MIDIRDAKISIFGLQGGGKTYGAKQIIKEQGLRVLVFSPHKHDFTDEPDNFFYYDGFNPREIERFLGQAKQLTQKGIIDGVLIDEFDMIFRNNFEIGRNAIDVFANHRHYGMCIIALSRRPQDIPAYYVESCKVIICFALQGANVQTKLNGIYRGFGDMVLNLNYDAYEYALKEIGRPPEKHSKM